MQLNAVRSLKITATTQGVEQAGAALNKVADAQKRVQGTAGGMASSTDRVAKGSMALAGTFEKLLARNDKLVAAQQRMDREMQIAERLYASGRIGAEQLAQATAAIERNFTRSSAAIAAQTMQLDRNAAAALKARAANHNVAGVSAQFQDVFVQSAAGQNPLQIALQQGTQLTAMLEQMKSTGQSTGRALALAFGSLISPLSLITVGAIAFGAVVIQAMGNLVPKTETATESIERHSEALRKIVSGYEVAEKAVSDFIEAASRPPRAVAEIQLAAQFRQLSDEVGQFIEQARTMGTALAGSVNATEDQVSQLLRSFTDGRMSAEDLGVALTRLANSNLGPMADVEIPLLRRSLRGMVQDLADGAVKAAAFGNALVSLSHAAAGLGHNAGVQLALDSKLEAQRSAEAHRIEMDAINAKSPAQMAEIARRREALALRDQEMTDALRQQKIEEAGALAFAQAAAARANADAETVNAEKTLIDSIEARIASAEMEAKALGMSEEAAARLRAEFEILQQFRQAGITPDPGQVDDFVNRMTAAEAATKRMNDAIAQQKRQLDQLANAAQSALGTLLEMTGLSGSPFGMGLEGALGPLMRGDIFGAAVGGVTGTMQSLKSAEATT